ncbi:hypothetical protein [Streptomyces asiaticus]
MSSACSGVRVHLVGVAPPGVVTHVAAHEGVGDDVGRRVRQRDVDHVALDELGVGAGAAAQIDQALTRLERAVDHPLDQLQAGEALNQESLASGWLA